MSLIVTSAEGAIPVEAASWHNMAALVPLEPFNTQVRPFLIDARSPSGERQRWVLKPYSRLGAVGSVCELVAARYYRMVGLRVPPFGIINVSDSLVRKLPPEARARLATDIGPNFGSMFLPGHDDIKAPQDVPSQEIEEAAGVFSCDVALDNPDRRDGKSNLLLGDDGVVAIDHQSAFSWYLDVLKPGPTWEQGMLARATARHFLRSLVTRCGATLQDMTAKLGATPGTAWTELTANVPQRWLADGGAALILEVDQFLADLRQQLPTILQSIRTTVLR